MHKIKWIKDNQELFNNSMVMRGSEIRAFQLIEAHKKHFSVEEQRQSLVAEQKAISKEIAADPSNSALIDSATRLKHKISEFDLDASLQQFNQLLLSVPNILDPSVPAGTGSHDNVIMYYHGEKPVVDDAKTHDNILPGLLDTDTATAISGSRYAILRGPLARLERALGQFMIDTHVDIHGFEEVAVPYIVKPQTLVGTGQLPKFEDDLFHVGDNFLIPTAEVPMTGMFVGRLDAVPQNTRMVALTPCFRSEAGSSGVDTRGLIRQHQFNKVELVSIVEEKLAAREHEFVRDCAELILQKLGLHYRVMKLCAPDTGFSASLTYDLEVWLPGQKEYREISSVSLCGDFQATRLNARYRVDGNPTYYHTINGSGVAVGRALVAVLENYQTPLGVEVPDVLRPYMGTDFIRARQ